MLPEVGPQATMSEIGIHISFGSVSAVAGWSRSCKLHAGEEGTKQPFGGEARQRCIRTLEDGRKWNGQENSHAASPRKRVPQLHWGVCWLGGLSYEMSSLVGTLVCQVQRLSVPCLRYLLVLYRVGTVGGGVRVATRRGRVHRGPSGWDSILSVRRAICHQEPAGASVSHVEKRLFSKLCFPFTAGCLHAWLTSPEMTLTSLSHLTHQRPSIQSSWADVDFKQGSAG